MENKCRLCLSKDKLIWIFDKRIINTNKLSDIIYNATGVHILETDSVTQMVCHECCLYTVDIYKFRVKCSINNNFLHSLSSECDKIKLDLPKILQSPSGRSHRKRQHDSNGPGRIKTETSLEEESSNDTKHNEDNGNGVDDNDAISYSPGPEYIPPPNRLMLTRSRRKLKSDIEKQKLDKQKIIESLYAENIDKIMFTSYLKLAPKYDISTLGNSSLRDGLISCKLCKKSLEPGRTLREHLEIECEVFSMMDNLPSVNVARMENVKWIREKYQGVLRNFRAVKTPKRVRCACCENCGD